MSRTRKSTKGAGYEYWSARTGNYSGGAPGKITKRHTHRIGRRRAKRETMKEQP